MENNKQVVVSIPAASSQKLIQCLINLEKQGDARTSAKMELITLTNQLMPAGKPQFLSVIKYPKISDLVKEHGYKMMLTVLTLMVKDFCSSINVVRNMNEDQMIETAAMLLEECDNFRLEDYTMMFALAKKGELFKIFDHLDIQVVTQILDAYWLRRSRAGTEAIESEENHMKQLGNPTKSIENMNPQDRKLQEGSDKLAGAFEALRDTLRDKE